MRKSKDYQIQLYLFHKNTFNIKDSVYLELFEDLLSKSSNSLLECSYKIKKNTIHSTRFNLYYDENIKDSINQIFEFFKKIFSKKEITLNYEILKQIFDNGFDLTKVKRVIAGIDLRENIQESRIKIWFLIKNYPEKINQILKIHKYNKEVLDMIHSNKLLFGIDISFDNKTKIKIYPAFKKELKNIAFQQKFKNIFSPDIYKAIMETKDVHFSFHPKDFSKTLYFHIYKKDINQIKSKIFTDLMKNNQFKNIFDKITKANYRLNYISLNEQEISSNNLSNINIYYV